MYYDLSIIIAVRNELKNLLWTLQGLQLEIRRLNAEVICVLNLATDEEYEKLLQYWPFQDGHMKVIRYDGSESCWQSRNVGARAANGRQLLFLDSHVMLRPGTIPRAIDYKDKYEGILHLAVNYWLNKPNRTVFQYKWQPEKFWGRWSRDVPRAPDYRILMSGFCGLMIQRELYIKFGGLHPELGIYGGGESYFDLKIQRLGYEVRCHPTLQLYHLNEKRGYSWRNEQVWRNFLIAAHSVGGQEYSETLYNHYKLQAGGETGQKELESLYNEARAVSENDRLFINSLSKKSLEEVLREHV